MGFPEIKTINFFLADGGWILGVVRAEGVPGVSSGLTLDPGRWEHTIAGQTPITFQYLLALTVCF